MESGQLDAWYAAEPHADTEELRAVTKALRTWVRSIVVLPDEVAEWRKTQGADEQVGGARRGVDTKG